MRNYLIGAVALFGLAAVGVRQFLRKREDRKQERHFRHLRQMLGVKPGVKDGGCEIEKPAGKVVPPAVAPRQSGPGTALILHPDAKGLRVNGSWLTTMNCTVEPEPVHCSRREVNVALERARRHNSACDKARRQHRWEEAQAHVDRAMAEVESHLRRDHWFCAEVLNQLACLTYERGNFVEAREIWWQAEQVCEEWPNYCKNIAVTVQENLDRVRGELGF
ncbi:tetratricopeptide repeat protein [Candidatus Obscuribacterales bacterium]|nr:tetratricopeptide repeat protein [Candidatus Obscuribacterales bacterium]